MTDVIYWARVTDLTQTITALPITNETLMLLEQTPSAWVEDEGRQKGLRLEQFDPTTDFNLWGRGRIFDRAFELRWERNDDALQVVYCGQTAGLPGFQLAEEVDLSKLDVKTSCCFLWGERVKEDDLPVIGQPPGSQIFVELQVPRLLRYPVSPQAQRVKLQVREYRDAKGELAYYRFQGLEEVL